MELHLKLRPKSLKTVKGQPEAVKVLEAMFRTRKVKHCILLTGPSGCGKTTLARIIAKFLECSKFDFKEINCSDQSGIDTIRQIRDRVSIRPIQGKAKVYYLDEVQRLTSDAQEAALKTLEEPPAFAYFILATTDPRKLKETIRTRCTEVKLKAMTTGAAKEVLQSAAEKEGIVLTEELTDLIIEKAQGSARKALVLLEQVMDIEDPEERLTAIQNADEKRDAVELCRVLCNPRAKWPEVAKVLQGIKEEDPEGIRRLVLSWFTSVLLKGGKLETRAANVLDYFQDEWLTGCGRAGLVHACYKVIQS